jgi:2-polyprenyl-3-methyl-5-hydroxy-6-metoxy-1,4-benzoquinol methylase
MADQSADTITYYDRHASSFAAQTADLDMSRLYGRFLRHMQAGGRILDAGCGVGRDALALPTAATGWWASAPRRKWCAWPESASGAWRRSTK